MQMMIMLINDDEELSLKIVTDRNSGEDDNGNDDGGDR
jgi:hypothetical protein